MSDKAFILIVEDEVALGEAILEGLRREGHACHLVESGDEAMTSIEERMGPVFGPKSRSCYVVDPLVLDPHMTEIGRNVTIGFRAIVTAHAQERDAVIYQKVVIEDNVLLGGDCKVYGGCRIKRGAVVLAGAVVTPGTVIGENELWGGMPARKIKDLSPYGESMPVADAS